MDKDIGITHEIDPRDMERAHTALARWMAECARAATDAWEHGQGGYIGRIKLCAFVDDNGIRLRIERSFSSDL